MELTLKAMIGQRLVAGFPGYEITDALRSVVKEYKVGNIILFAENVRDCAQLRRLCAQLQELIRGETGLPAFITIDQEGGVVSRLGEDAAVVPGAMCVSATGNPHNAWTAGYITGRELEMLGLVQGSTIQAKNIGRDITQALKSIVGGELESYTDTMNQARALATQRMTQQAEAMGADAIVAVRYASSTVMEGAAEIIAYGTAVKFR